MKCAWKELLGILPQRFRSEVDRFGPDDSEELRFRLNSPPELVMRSGVRWLKDTVTESDLKFVVNTASQYSPWSAETIRKGYITAPGGHRIGLCGEAVMNCGQMMSLRSVTSVNIRIAKDMVGITGQVQCGTSVLILGPPGSGKTTLLRDLARKIAETELVCVVDEREELFPSGFRRGKRMDVLSGCGKKQGIDILLQTMGPAYIAVDEITSGEDCEALRSAGWCGVRLLATAHASTREDLQRRPVYKPLWESGLFDTLIILGRDKHAHEERVFAR